MAVVDAGKAPIRRLLQAVCSNAMGDHLPEVMEQTPAPQEPQEIPQEHMSHDMTHEYDVCVVRKINRASFISAIPTISAISTEAFGYLYNSGMDCTVNMCQTMFGF